MAKLTTSRARKPIAENHLSLGWSNYSEGERFNVSIEGDPDSNQYTFFKLSMTRLEAEKLSKDLQAALINPEYLRAAGLKSS